MRRKYAPHIAAGIGGAIFVFVLLIIGLIVFKAHNYVLIHIINSESASFEYLDKIESVRHLKENGLVLTPSEYTSNIAGFYNTIITLIIALFGAFAIITYRISKRNVQDQVNEEVEKTLSKIMMDSKEFDNKVFNAIYSKMSQEFATIEQLQALDDSVNSKLFSQITTSKNANGSENAIVDD